MGAQDKMPCLYWTPPKNLVRKTLSHFSIGEYPTTRSQRQLVATFIKRRMFSRVILYLSVIMRSTSENAMLVT